MEYEAYYPRADQKPTERGEISGRPNESRSAGLNVGANRIGLQLGFLGPAFESVCGAEHRSKASRPVGLNIGANRIYSRASRAQLWLEINQKQVTRTPGTPGGGFGNP